MPLAAIPAIIGASAIAAGGSIAGGAIAGHKSSQEKSLLGQEAENAKQGGEFASQLIPQSTKALGSAQNFWQSILNGNQQNTAIELAPTVNNIRSQSRQAEKSALEFLPRGGGQTETLSEIPYQRANAVTGAITNLAAQAPNELAQIGLAEGGLADSALNSSTSSAASGLNFLQASSAQAQQTGSSIGSGIGSLLYYYLNGQSASGGGGSSIIPDDNGFGSVVAGNVPVSA